jgi:hypothetical protein
VPASLEAEPPRRMTASEGASLDAWMIKTYLGCWRPPAQPGHADRYVARVRLKFKPDGSLLKPPKLVNEQWKTRTVLFDPQVATR